MVERGHHGGAALSVDVKKNIIHMYYNVLMTVEEIAPLIKSPRRLLCGVNVRTVQDVLDFFELWHHVEDVPRAPRTSRMPEAHFEVLLEIVNQTPWFFLDEIAAEMLSRCHVPYHSGYCYAMLKRRGHSLVVMRRIARQRDEDQRFRYFLALSKILIRSSQLVFADEVGQDGRGSRRRRGWSLPGKRCDITEFLNRGKHISILALYSNEGFVNFNFKEGGYSAEDFMDAVKFMIIPHLQPYPQDNSILVLDNCQIHHTFGEALREMVEAAGAKLLFLAPYCPIDNPIECAFSSFKACWRRHGHWLDMPPLHEKIDFCFRSCGSNGAAAVKTYRKCGYIQNNNDHSSSSSLQAQIFRFNTNTNTSSTNTSSSYNYITLHSNIEF